MLTLILGLPKEMKPHCLSSMMFTISPRLRRRFSRLAFTKMVYGSSLSYRVMMCCRYCAWCLGHASSVSSVTGTSEKDAKHAADLGAIASARARVTPHLEYRWYTTPLQPTSSMKEMGSSQNTSATPMRGLPGGSVGAPPWVWRATTSCSSTLRESGIHGAVASMGCRLEPAPKRWEAEQAVGVALPESCGQPSSMPQSGSNTLRSSGRRCSSPVRAARVA
mmetsp:Transcript_44794/g.115971  ORF Transcript_44794/g.115971 Transcript_44794/m.115971 type:complete len:221 (-) Transcript_44794:1194-1856(-)